MPDTIHRQAGAAGRSAPVRWLLRTADHLTRALLWWLLGAAAVGLMLRGPAAALADGTSVILALMVAGLGLGVAPASLREGLTQPRLVGVVLAGQLAVTPVVGWLLAATGGVGVGAAIQAAAPAEITSPLLVALAGGSAAVAVPVMAVTVLLAPLTMPPVLAVTAGSTVSVDAAGLLVSLLWTVAAPVLVGSVVHRVASGHREVLTRAGRGLSAAMVILLVFAVSGRAAVQLAGRGLATPLAAAGMAAIILVVGFATGAGLGRLIPLGDGQRRVVLFTVGMREFGIATAVALGFFSADAALVPAIYGPLLMVAAATLARRLDDPP